MTGGNTIADVEEDYEAVVKITVKAKNAEEAQQKIEDYLSDNEVIEEYEFVTAKLDLTMSTLRLTDSSLLPQMLESLQLQSLYVVR